MSELNLEDTLAKFIDGQLTPEEDRRLASEAHANPEIRRRLLDEVELARLLRQLPVTGEEFLRAFQERFRADGLPYPFVTEVTRRMSGGKDRHGRQSGFSRGRIKAFRMASMAVAAAALIAVGLWWATTGGRKTAEAVAGFTVADREGAVTVERNRVVTGADSFCRLEARDGSVVVVGPDSRTSVTRGRRDAGMTFQHEAGRLYLDRVNPLEPWNLKTGDLDVALLGTRLCVRNDGTMGRIDVLDGAIKGLRHGGAGTTVSAGQSLVTLFATSGKLSDRQRILFVKSRKADASYPVWPKRAGVRMASGTYGAAAHHPGAFAVLDGSWKVSTQTNGSVHAVREDIAGFGRVLIGNSFWTRASISFRCRLINLTPGSRYQSYGIGIVGEAASQPRPIGPFVIQHDGPVDSKSWTRVEVGLEMLKDYRMRILKFRNSAFGFDHFKAFDGVEFRLKNYRPQKYFGFFLASDNCSMEFADVEIHGQRALPGPIRELGLSNEDMGEALQFYWDRGANGEPGTASKTQTETDETTDLKRKK